MKEYVQKFKAKVIFHTFFEQFISHKKVSCEEPNMEINGACEILKSRLCYQQLKLLDNRGKLYKQWTYLLKYFLISVVVLSFHSSGV